MSRRILLALVVVGAAGLVLALGVGVVLTAPDTTIPWSAFGSGGGTSSSTNYDVGSTAGQSSAIGESASTSYDLCAGFWCSAGVAAGPTPGPVGGFAELPRLDGGQADVDGVPLQTGGSWGSNYGLLVAVVAAVSVGATALAGAAWYARWRRAG